jgi:predicted acyl esterase
MPPMRPMRALAALPLLGLAMAGCLSGGPATVILPGQAYAPLEQAAFNATGSYSMPLAPPKFGFAKPVGLELPSFDGTLISVGVHRPDIPGCPDTLEGEFPPECRTPVLIDAGPYFTEQSVLQLSTRPPTGIWFVPQGYTMVYVAVRGTGGSGGCMELMSMNEQRDVDAMVTWAGTQPWSTGNVGMVGRSYDGTTPLFPAALGNPHLKTIVPISGVADLADLMFANGTSELRGSIMHSFVYWFTYGVGAEPTSSAASQFCPEVAKGAALGPYAAATGDTGSAGLDTYWQDRAWRERVLANYNGSLFIIHGMQDWNVNPRMVVPWINELQDAGIRVKAWLGQWGHAYPDRPDEHPNVRWDWAEVLLRWLDRELKGVDVDTGPAIEVEDHRHQWWVEESYPPRDALWHPLHLNGDGTATLEPGEAGTCQPLSVPGTPVSSCAFVSGPLDGPVRVSGLVGLDLKVTPSTASGGTVYVQLHDIYPDGRSAWFGHGWINLRYHDGGREARTLVPGVPVVARIQFEPLEAYLAEGHRVRLVVSQDVPAGDGVTGADPRMDLLPRPEQGPFTIHADGESVLRLPLVRELEPSPYHGYRFQPVPEIS